MIKNLLIFLALFVTLSGCTDSGEVRYTNDYFNKTTSTISVDATNYNANIRAEEGQLLRIRVNKGGLYEEPLKYRAIVRLDPRFTSPFLFAVRMDNNSLKYTPNWNDAGNNFNSNVTLVNQQFNYNPIAVHAGDFVSFKMITPAQFYDSNMTRITSDLTGKTLQGYNYLDLSSLVTSSGGVDNAIINTTDVAAFCSYNSSLCNTLGGYFPSSSLTYSQLLLGVANFSNVQALNSCTTDATPAGICKYDRGAGLEFRLNGDLIKKWDKRFVTTIKDGVANKVYYFIAENDGNVNFTFPNSLSFKEIFAKIVTVTTQDQQITKTITTTTCEPYTRSCQWLGGCGYDLCYYGDSDSFYGTTDMSYCDGCVYVQPCSGSGGWYPLYLKNRVDKNCCDGGNYNINLPDKITVNGVQRSIGQVNVSINNGVVTVLDRLCRDATTTKVVSFIPGSTTTTTTPFRNQYMSTWQGIFTDSRDIMNLLSTSATPYQMQKYAAGRYFFEIDVGSASGAALRSKIDNVKVKYTIKDGSNVLTSGYVTGDVLEINAPASGNIYLAVENPYPEINGSVDVQVQTYTASAEIAKFLNDELVVPLKEQLLNLSADFFGAVVKDRKFILFVQSCLTLYLLFYGFNFAMGAVEITINDLVTRVIKILFVSALFSDMSWSFFYDYLFSNFLNTSDKLINAVMNDTAIVGNIFGFIDPMINKYFDKSLWTIIGVYIMWAGYGYIFAAGFLMAGIFFFFRAIVRIFISYLLAYLSLCVMIAMGPLFITAILFERTKDYFDNWISLMFSYMIQPFIIMTFMLFIDQITADLLVNGLLPVRFDSCIYDIGLYTSTPDLDLHFFCVAGYTPYPLSTPVVNVYRVSVLFFCIMKLAGNVAALSEAFVDRLTMSSAGQGAASGGGTSHMRGLMSSHSIAVGKFAAVKSAKGVWKGVKFVHNTISDKIKSLQAKNTRQDPEVPITQDPAKDPYSMQNLEKHEKDQKDAVPEGKARVKQPGGYDTFEDKDSTATPPAAGAANQTTQPAVTGKKPGNANVDSTSTATRGEATTAVTSKPGARTTMSGKAGVEVAQATNALKGSPAGNSLPDPTASPKRERVGFAPTRTRSGAERAEMIGAYKKSSVEGRGLDPVPTAHTTDGTSISKDASGFRSDTPAVKQVAKKPEGAGENGQTRNEGSSNRAPRKTRGTLKKESNVRAKSNFKNLTTKK